MSVKTSCVGPTSRGTCNSTKTLHSLSISYLHHRMCIGIERSGHSCHTKRSNFPGSEFIASSPAQSSPLVARTEQHRDGIVKMKGSRRNSRRYCQHLPVPLCLKREMQTSRQPGF